MKIQNIAIGQHDPIYKHIQDPKDTSKIIHTCITNYRFQQIKDFGKFGQHKVYDRNESDEFNIPYFFCPICGTKTNNQINEYYNKIQHRG